MINRHRLFLSFWYMVGCFLILRFPENFIFQPVHIVMLVMPIYGFFNLSKMELCKEYLLRFTLVFFSFLFFSLINFFWYVETGIGLINVFYWIVMAFNVYVFFFLINRELICSIVNGAVITYLLSVFVAFTEFTFASEFSRPTGLSGTPNHLALQGILLLCIMNVMAIKNGIISNLMFYIGVVLSFSRSAIAGIIFYLFLRNVFLIFVLLVLIFLVTFPFFLSGFKYIFGMIDVANIADSYIFERFLVFGNSSDSDGRGFYRLSSSPEFFLLGASDFINEFEGDPFRGLIHNNVLQMAFGFGVLGLFVSLYQHWVIFKAVGFSLFFLFLPFSMTHFFFQNFLFVFLFLVSLRYGYSSR